MKSDSDPREIYDPRTDTVERMWPVFTSAPQYLPTHNGEPGAYEKRLTSDGAEIVTGECAAGDGPIREGDPYVIRYHQTISPGGIFHQRCDPSLADPMWYNVDGEAPDV